MTYVLEEKKGNDNLFVSYKSGSVFKQYHLFCNKTFSLQIGLYYDDFETANPLGESTNWLVFTGLLLTCQQNLGPVLTIFNLLCRYCLATNLGALQKSLSDAEVFPLRTPVNYQYHLAQVVDGVADPSTYGIRSDSDTFIPQKGFSQMCHMT